MLYLITSALVLLAALALFFLTPSFVASASVSQPAARAHSIRSFRAVVVAIAVAVEAVFALFNSYHQVPTGHVGVVYQFGGIVGQRPEGLQWTAPWQSTRAASIQTQRHFFKHLGTFSKQTQAVFIDATINIRVSPTAIQRLYRTVGHGYFEVLVAPKVEQFLKDETVKYDTVDIAPHREQLRTDVKRRLNEALRADSIEVVDFLLNDIDFRTEFKTAIEQKQIATQTALKEEQLIKVKQYKADQRRAEAQGEADAVFIQAKRQAEANELLARSITPTLVAWQTVQKLAPNVTTILLPANQPLLLGGDALGFGARK